MKTNIREKIKAVFLKIKEKFTFTNKQDKVVLKRINYAIMLLSFLGIGLCMYLWYVHIQSLKAFCPTGGCDVVLSSQWAVFLGEPVAAWGMLFYVGVFGLSIMRLLSKDKRWSIAMLVFLVIGLVFTFYLRVIEIAFIHSICLLCWGSVVILLVIFILDILYSKKSRLG